LGVKNALETIRIAKQTQPQVILLDIVMPEMDGYETCALSPGVFIAEPAMVLSHWY
jgi:chemotaxis response regulator CheB